MAKKRNGSARKKTTEQAGTIHQFEIFLAETKPRIWRRFEVRSDITLAELHDIIQTVMGWYDCHLHQFIDAKERRYGPHDDDMDAEWDADVTEECEVPLRDVMPTKGSRLAYEYDFGDGWEHGLKVVAIGPPQPGVRYPRCVAGGKACPPEDCGGVWGYYEMLKILADPKHEEHDSYREWIGDKFDPDKFDLNRVNKALASIT
jgi:hypothetical protein